MWILISNQNVKSLREGDLIAQNNPEKSPTYEIKEKNTFAPLEAIYTVKKVSEPEIAEVYLKTETFVSGTITKKHQALILEEWWLLIKG